MSNDAPTQATSQQLLSVGSWADLQVLLQGDLALAATFDKSTPLVRAGANANTSWSLRNLAEPTWTPFHQPNHPFTNSLSFQFEGDPGKRYTTIGLDSGALNNAGPSFLPGYFQNLLSDFRYYFNSQGTTPLGDAEVLREAANTFGLQLHINSSNINLDSVPSNTLFENNGNGEGSWPNLTLDFSSDFFNNWASLVELQNSGPFSASIIPPTTPITVAVGGEKTISQLAASVNSALADLFVTTSLDESLLKGAEISLELRRSNSTGERSLYWLKGEAINDNGATGSTIQFSLARDGAVGEEYEEEYDFHTLTRLFEGEQWYVGGVTISNYGPTAPSHIFAPSELYSQAPISLTFSKTSSPLSFETLAPAGVSLFDAALLDSAQDLLDPSKLHAAWNSIDLIGDDTTYGWIRFIYTGSDNYGNTIDAEIIGDIWGDTDFSYQISAPGGNVALSGPVSLTLSAANAEWDLNTRNYTTDGAYNVITTSSNIWVNFNTPSSPEILATRSIHGGEYLATPVLSLNDFFANGTYQNIATFNFDPSLYVIPSDLKLAVAPSWQSFDSQSGDWSPIAAVLDPWELNRSDSEADPYAKFSYRLDRISNVAPETGLQQLAVLGDGVYTQERYRLVVTAESLKQEEGWGIEALELKIGFDPSLFNTVLPENILIGNGAPVANQANVDFLNGQIIISLASVKALGLGDAITAETVIATVDLDFNESYLNIVPTNADGSLQLNKLGFDIIANQNAVALVKHITDSDGSPNIIETSLAEISLGGYSVEGTDVTLYDAKVNLEELGDGITLGTQRIIGVDKLASFTNLIRSGDTVTAETSWLNTGNITATGLTAYATGILNAGATFVSGTFTERDVKSGVYEQGVFNSEPREATTLTATFLVNGAAGQVIDVSQGLFSIQADASADTFTNQNGSRNLITFQGDLNYDGRVSMKDLAYLNAGAARLQVLDEQAPDHFDPLLVARDVDADFNGRIDLADLAVLDQDWGKTLHTGNDEGFIGSNRISWDALDKQGASSEWSNDSFKAQNAIEASPSFIAPLESSSGMLVIGGDGNGTPNDGGLMGTFFQDNQFVFV